MALPKFGHMERFAVWNLQRNYCSKPTSNAPSITHDGCQQILGVSPAEVIRFTTVFKYWSRNPSVARGTAKRWLFRLQPSAQFWDPK
jgi:hypothetical protein